MFATTVATMTPLLLLRGDTSRLDLMRDPVGPLAGRVVERLAQTRARAAATEPVAPPRPPRFEMIADQRASASDGQAGWRCADRTRHEWVLP